MSEDISTPSEASSATPEPILWSWLEGRHELAEGEDVQLRRELQDLQQHVTLVERRLAHHMEQERAFTFMLSEWAKQAGELSKTFADYDSDRYQQGYLHGRGNMARVMERQFQQLGNMVRMITLSAPQGEP